MPPSPRPSPRHGVAVRPSNVAFGIGVDDFLIGPGRRVVAFVDDHQIRRRQMHGIALDGAPVQRLDRGDLHALERTRRKPGLDDAVARYRARAACRWSA